jgi:hypothetical protein
MATFIKYCATLALVGQGVWANDGPTKGNATELFAMNLLHESMDWMDMYYDSQRGYLFRREQVCGMQLVYWPGTRMTMLIRRYES